jgi:hypothetical protein
MHALVVFTYLHSRFTHLLSISSIYNAVLIIQGAYFQMLNIPNVMNLVKNFSSLTHLQTSPAKLGDWKSDRTFFFFFLSIPFPSAVSLGIGLK